MAVAKRRAIDRLRRNERLDRRHEQLARELETRQDSAEDGVDDALDDEFGDDLLRLIFISCHPVLPTQARVALTLRLLGGLTTEEIARAFLVSEPTVAQRIVRAKRTLAAREIPFEVPPAPERAARLSSVLEVIYLVFNEGYAATAGDDWMRPALCLEALRLGRVLADLAPADAEVHGLVALMEIQASRSAARTGPAGEPIPLLDQNRGRWDPLLIRRGFAALLRARELGGPPGPYVLQAAIAVCHAQARAAQDTDWAQIVALYDVLVRLLPTPVVRLNRAVAVGLAQGPAAGLALVEQLVAEPALAGYHLLPGVRGDLLDRLGRHAEAGAEFARAAALTRNAPQRAVLVARAAACEAAAEQPPPPGPVPAEGGAASAAAGGGPVLAAGEPTLAGGAGGSALAAAGGPTLAAAGGPSLAAPGGSTLAEPVAGGPDLAAAAGGPSVAAPGGDRTLATAAGGSTLVEQVAGGPDLAAAAGGPSVAAPGGDRTLATAAGGSTLAEPVARGPSLAVAADAFLGRRDLDAGTVRSYGQTLRRLRRDLGDDTPLAGVTAERVAGVFDAAWGPAAARTWNRHRAAVRSFGSWAAGRGLAVADLAAALDRRAESGGTAAAIDRERIAALCADGAALRERALWLLLYESAAPVDSVLSLNIEDVDQGRRRARCAGRGGADRWVRWHAGTAGLLPELTGGRTRGPLFLASRRPAPARAPAPADLCPDTGRRRLSYERAEYLFKQATKRHDPAGEGYTLRQLRRSRLAHLDEDGWPAPALGLGATRG